MRLLLLLPLLAHAASPDEPVAVGGMPLAKPILERQALPKVSAGDALRESAAPAAPSPVPLPTFSGPSPLSAPAAPAPMCGGSEERQQLDKLTTVNQIDQQRFQQRQRPLIEERDEAAARNNILFEKQKLDIAPLEAELKRLQLQASIDEEKFRKEVSPARRERDRLEAENALAREKLQSEQLKAERERLRMEAVTRELDFQERKLKHDSEMAESRAVALRTDLDLREKREKWKKEANREPEYLDKPFQNGVLTISDRRIVLNGPIVYGMGDHVTERIHYFNNKSETLPIFIVIDYSPGGSVMEGERIIKAMKGSKAPVHVVVKSFAASMAATIATVAPHSYAYPNAIILHHQVWSVAWGNPIQQKQQLEIHNEWNRRILGPVAKKMGLSLEGLTKKMYEHNVDGDWEEFGDSAVALKWVDTIVPDIRETGFLKEPEDKKSQRPMFFFGLNEEKADSGEAFVRLPKLRPFDAYFLYNRDNYYR